MYCITGLVNDTHNMYSSKQTHFLATFACKAGSCSHQTPTLRAEGIQRLCRMEGDGYTILKVMLVFELKLTRELMSAAKWRSVSAFWASSGACNVQNAYVHSIYTHNQLLNTWRWGRRCHDVAIIDDEVSAFEDCLTFLANSHSCNRPVQFPAG